MTEKENISSRCIMHWHPRTLVLSLIDRVISRVKTRHVTLQGSLNCSVYKHVLRRKVWGSWQTWSSTLAANFLTPFSVKRFKKFLCSNSDFCTLHIILWKLCKKSVFFHHQLFSPHVGQASLKQHLTVDDRTLTLCWNPDKSNSFGVNSS